MATITEILHTCEVGDKLTNDTFNWTVTDRYIEEDDDDALIVIATPDEDNSYSFELWSCGVENYSYMPKLRKIE